MKFSPCLALLFWSSPAWSLESLVSFPEGPPLSGEEVPIEILFHDEGQRIGGAAPAISVEAGRITRREGEELPGTWRYRYLAPDEAQQVELRIEVDDVEFVHTIPVNAELPSTLDSGPIRWARAGQTAPLEFEIAGIPADAGDFLQIGFPEGQILETLGREVLTVSWQPGPDPFPRAVPLGFRDERQPGTTPAWTVVYLRSNPSIPVRTEPGTEVHIEVNGRTYGPFVADSNGLARATAEVRPGETTAEVTLRDSAGNTQRNTVSLGGDPSPGIVAIAEGFGATGGKSSVIHVFAIRADGRAWRGTPPTCQSSLGQTLTGVAAGAGAWRYTLPTMIEGAFFDIRVDCVLGESSRTSVRVPIVETPAARLTVRAYPSELDAEYPVAQIEAFLENTTGDRVTAEGVELEADLGTVEVLPNESTPAALRAAYTGDAAVAAGTDWIRASWLLPPGDGGVWGLTVAGDCPEEEEYCLAWARALDRAGRPLEAVEIEVHAGSESITVVTDERGWASASVRGPEAQRPFIAFIRTGTVERELILIPGERSGPEIGRPDLVAEAEITLRSGQVRNVRLNAEPNPLFAGRDVNARVRLRLVDGDGNAVQDDSLEIEATEGVLTEPRFRGGAYEATWAPRPGMSQGVVDITARSGDQLFGDTTTQIEVSPRPVNTSIGMEGGWIWGPDGIDSPWLGGSIEMRAPNAERPIFGRVEIGSYRITNSSTDPSTGELVRIETSLVPVGLGFVLRQERGRWGTWLAGSLRLLPHRLQLFLGDEQVLNYRSIGIPGASLMAGGGYRLRGTEIYGQISYEIASMPGEEVGFSGPVGGVCLRGGYRVLF